MDWNIKIEGRFAKINDVIITFTEMSIIKYLQDNEDRVVTTEELKNAVQKNNPASARGYDVHISRIRSKFFRIPIEMVWNKGYRWREK